MPTTTEQWNCANGLHIGDEEDICTLCGKDLNPPNPMWEQRQEWVKAVNEERTTQGLYEWLDNVAQGNEEHSLEGPPLGYSVDQGSDGTWAWFDPCGLCSWELDDGVFSNQRKAVTAAWADWATQTMEKRAGR